MTNEPVLIVLIIIPCICVSCFVCACINKYNRTQVQTAQIQPVQEDPPRIQTVEEDPS